MQVFGKVPDLQCRRIPPGRRIQCDERRLLEAAVLVGDPLRALGESRARAAMAGSSSGRRAARNHPPGVRASSSRIGKPTGRPRCGSPGSLKTRVGATGSISSISLRRPAARGLARPGGHAAANVDLHGRPDRDGAAQLQPRDHGDDGQHLGQATCALRPFLGACEPGPVARKPLGDRAVDELEPAVIVGIHGFRPAAVGPITAARPSVLNPRIG